MGMIRKSTIKDRDGATFPISWEDLGKDMATGEHRTRFKINGAEFISRYRGNDAHQRMATDITMIAAYGYDPTTIDFESARPE